MLPLLTVYVTSPLTAFSLPTAPVTLYVYVGAESPYVIVLFSAVTVTCFAVIFAALAFVTLVLFNS